MHIGICDDNVEEREYVVSLLKDYRQEKRAPITWRCFSSATELSLTIRPAEYDLLILDILMPKTNGMTASYEIRKIDADVKIIFLTSSVEFAVESYCVHAMDYMLKPVDRVRLFAWLDRLMLEQNTLLDALPVKTLNGMVRIVYARLMYVEVFNKHIYFHLSDGSVRTARGTLSEYEGALLSNENFIKPHRSYIVNLMYVTEIKECSFVLYNGETVPISRLLFSQVRAEYMSYLFGKMKGKR